MTEAAFVNLERLLRPIRPDSPGGDDISFDGVYDEIEQARVEENASLATGVWARELRTADWPRVRELTASALAERSKDLKLACWLAEALTQLHGFAGARDGLLMLAELLCKHWEHLYPEDDGDLEPRANRLAWLNGQLARLIRAQPLTAEGGSWYHYQGALEVDNAAERDRNAKAALLAEGKIDGDTWRKQVAASASEDLAAAYQDLGACQEAWRALDGVVDDTFGRERPSLRDLGNAIDDVLRLLTGILKERGMAVTQVVELAPAVQDAPGATRETPTVEAATASEPAAPVPTAVITGKPQNRVEALRQLADIAEFFRRTEPHSPVAYVLERAVKWGNMPLDLWLQEVVKDPGVLSTLHETLGVGVRE